MVHLLPRRRQAHLSPARQVPEGGYKRPQWLPIIIRPTQLKGPGEWEGPALETRPRPAMLSLGHVSLITTERYLGVQQDLTEAPCDHIELDLKAG